MPPSPPARATSSRRRPSPSVSVVIPVRDAVGLPLTLRGLPPADEVIVVTDAVAEAAAAVRAACPGALLVRPTRCGVGNALACGFAASTGDIVVALDGAGSTDPAEIPRYVAALVAGADVALGSRYRDGGRDLTGGRFRRWADLLLIWAVNVLFGVRRTDPGFGYAAFWRAAIDRLDLPDPSGRAPAAWGDGPEFAALLTVRTAARGLAVTEVPSTAYPRLRPADRTTIAHWLRAIAAEYPTRTHPAPRHAATPSPTAQPAAVPFPRPAPAPSTKEPIWAPPRRRPSPSRDLWQTDKPSTLDRTAGHTSPQSHRDAKPSRHDPAHRDPGPFGPGRWTADPGERDAAAGWQASPAARNGPAPKPRDPETGRTAAARKRNEQRRNENLRGDDRHLDDPTHEVGSKRRRLDAYRQRPDLRVINGEGTNPGRTRSGRLRAVPRENLGG